MWVTRLRATLPRASLAVTLELEPTAKQDPFDNEHYAARLGSTTGAPFSVARSALVDKHGTYALVAVTAVVLSRLLRRKKKEKA